MIMNGVIIPGVSAGSNHVGASEMCTPHHLPFGGGQHRRGRDQDEGQGDDTEGGNERADSLMTLLLDNSGGGRSRRAGTR
jgi:hypothetical protein